jgi:anti-anti-sigma factor
VQAKNFTSEENRSMEITVRESGGVELIAVQGRMDSVEAPRFEKALQDANQRGLYNLVIDMAQLEYMSSAGFRALVAAQRNSRRHQRGDVVLVQVPGLVYEALAMVGFAEHFSIFKDVPSAVESLQKGMAGDSASDARSRTSEG